MYSVAREDGEGQGLTGKNNYNQHESPGKDKEANRLPSAKEEITLALRLYVSKKQVVDGIWKPQPVMMVK